MSECTLREEMDAIIEEINKYKWIESEKAGYDIGSNRAAFEWIDKHYDNWKYWWLVQKGC